MRMGNPGDWLARLGQAAAYISGAMFDRNPRRLIDALSRARDECGDDLDELIRRLRTVWPRAAATGSREAATVRLVAGSLLGVYLDGEALAYCAASGLGAAAGEIAHAAATGVFQTLLCRFAPLPFSDYEGFRSVVADAVERVLDSRDPRPPTL